MSSFAFLVKDYPDFATSVGTCTKAKVEKKVPKQATATEAKGENKTRGGGKGGHSGSRGRGGRGGRGRGGGVKRTVKLFDTVPAGCPDSKTNFAPLDAKTSAKYKALLLFLGKNCQLIHGSVLHFIKYLDQTRDRPDDIPMDRWLELSEYDASQLSMGGSSHKHSDDHNCWCWSADQDGTSDFCRLHFDAK